MDKPGTINDNNESVVLNKNQIYLVLHTHTHTHTHDFLNVF